MRPLNLRSVIIADKRLSKEQRDRLFEFWEIKPKPEEVDSMRSFGMKLLSWTSYDTMLMTRLLDGCYFGFRIPHIPKELDCLWIGEKTVVNLELKSRETKHERIKKQLEQNRYYLHYLERDIKAYTFVATTGECFSLDEDSNLVSVPFKDVASALYRVHKEKLFDGEIETLFPLEQILVSPFNSTKEFLEGKYYLTKQQGEFKNSILSFIDDSSAGCFCGLTGGPGTGKSLLLYDIAKTLMLEGKKVVIGHSGLLNAGHEELIKHGWQIKSTQNLISRVNDKNTIIDIDVDAFLIDEAQRCYPYIMDALFEDIVKRGKKCIFSYDSEQIMSEDEDRRNNGDRIQELASGNIYELSSNIRTNSDVYGFVEGLFNIRHPANPEARKHVDISYCHTFEQAKELLLILKSNGYKVPKFTPKLHGYEEYEAWFLPDENSAHQIIGQEFNSIVGLLSNRMYYNDDGKLVSKGRYLYREDRMLYQILTRARHKIHLVIVDNPAILERCMKLLLHDESQNNRDEDGLS